MYRATIEKLPLRDGLEMTTLVHAGPLPPAWLAPGYVVNLVVEGRAELVARGVTHLVEPGWVVLADWGEVRAVRRRYSTRAVTRSLTFTEKQLRRALEERARLDGSLHFGTNATQHLGAPLRRLYGAIDRRDGKLAVDEAFERLLDAIMIEAPHPPQRAWPRHPAVRRAVALLRERFQEDVSLDELASEVALSRAHLLRAFGREVGIPPHAFLIQLRVAHARALLARGLPMVEVSAACGFWDQSHFTRHFLRLVGVTPGTYARAVGAK